MRESDRWHDIKYSESDLDFVKETLSEFDYHYQGHTGRFFGLKAWVGKNLDKANKLLMVAWRLRNRCIYFQNMLVECQRHLKATSGSTMLVDLGHSSFSKITIWQKDKFKGILVGDQEADKLTKAINTALKDQYEIGFEAGSNLLGRLGSGDMSVLDFEEKQKKAGDFRGTATPGAPAT